MSACQIARNPSNALVEKMLNKTLETISDSTRQEITDKNNPRTLAIHTDRGGHYRGEIGVEKLEGKGIIRSISQKSKSGDDAACEGFLED